MSINNNDDTRRTIHDCIGSLALMPNVPNGEGLRVGYELNLPWRADSLKPQQRPNLIQGGETD